MCFIQNRYVFAFKCIGVDNFPANYFMYEGMQLTFRADKDNIDLGQTTNRNCISQSFILDDREKDHTYIGDV